jgi:branched-chain amino acid transport system permease protein
MFPPLAFAAALLCATPWLTGFWSFKLGTVIVYALALRSLQFLIGSSGQVSLGHSAFIAIGAYVGGALVAGGWVGEFWSHPLAALVCGVLGVLFGWPAVRLAGPYLALATFALALALPQLFKHPVLEKVTGGVSGLSLDAGGWSTWFGILPPEKFALLQCVAWGLAGFGLLQRVLAGPAGTALLGLRDHPTAATAVGVNVRLWKALAFGLSAAVAGLAGSMNTSLTHFVSPDNYGVFLSLLLLAGVSIAGQSANLGVLVGALFLVFVPDVAERINRDATGFIFGAIMLACVYAGPAAGALRRRFFLRQAPVLPERTKVRQ